MIHTLLSKILLVSKKERKSKAKHNCPVKINSQHSIIVSKFVTQIMGHQTDSWVGVQWGLVK